MPFWAKYNTSTTFQFPLIKRGVVDFAQTGDYTPASTDAAVSKDNGSYADTTNTIAIVGGSPTRGVSMFKLALTGTELSCAVACVQIVDAATKAVEDQSFEVYTYGNASAFFAGDWSDIVRLGLTALPNAAAGATGGLPLGVDSSGRVDVLKINGTSQTARDIGASVLLSAGSGTGQLDFTSGVVKANLAQILGTALTETAGLLAGGFKKFFNISTPAATMDHGVLVDTVTTTTTATTATNLTNAPTAGDFTATMKTSIGTAVAASAVASVTGNVSGNVVGSVGSVVGNVGGNVTGSAGSVVGAVGSVTGAVGSVTGNVGGNVVGSVASVTAGVSLTAGQLFIKKNTALANFEFIMTDSTTHAPKTGVTVTTTRNIDSAGFGATTNSATEVANGWYTINLAAADLNGTVIAFRFTGASSDDLNFTVITQT